MSNMYTIDAFDAKTHFFEYLKEVEKGGEVIIAKHGRPIAKLIPAEKTLSLETKKKVIEKIMKFSKTHSNVAKKLGVKVLLS